MLQLAAAHRKDQLNPYFNRAILGPRLLVIDELGYLPFGRAEANLLFQVIAKRYERGSIIITSNLSFSDWASALADDATLTAALLDRLLHHGHIVACRGDSYRLKDKRRAGMTKAKQRRTRWLTDQRSASAQSGGGQIYFGVSGPKGVNFQPGLTTHFNSSSLRQRTRVSIPRHHVVKPVVSQLLVALDSRIAERSVLIATKREYRLVHLLGIEHIETHK